MNYLRRYEEHFAKDIVLNVINKYLKAESFKSLSLRFNEKWAAQVLSPDFPSKEILDELVVTYKDDIRRRGIMGTEGRITVMVNNMRKIFQRED